MELIDDFLAHSRRYGVVLDTNIYILYITGIVNSEMMGSGRTEKYTQTHFEIVRSIVNGAKTKAPIITPHIVPEITHLLGVDKNRRGSDSSIFEDALLNSFKISREEYIVTAKLIRDNEKLVRRFGVSDVSVAKIINDYALLSDDNELVAYLQGNGKSAMTLDMLYSQEVRHRAKRSF
jgi:hypothetical protein